LDDNFIDNCSSTTTTGTTGTSTTGTAPEPSSIFLFGSGLLAAIGAVRRKLF